VACRTDCKPLRLHDDSVGLQLPTYLQLLFRKQSMTMTTTQSTEPAGKQTLQQHHQQAGEHLQHAATSHLAAAKSHGAGDAKAADQHAKTASDHTAQAAQHVSHAEKAQAPGGSDKPSQQSK